MRGLDKNDCQSSAQSIKIASIGEKPPNSACCLVCCPCLLYNKEFPSGGRDLHAGSAATATGSGLYWYLSLKYVLSPAKQCVCNMCFSEPALICLSMFMSVWHTWSLLGWLQLRLDVYFTVYKIDSSVIFSCDETLCIGDCVFPLLIRAVKAQQLRKIWRNEMTTRHRRHKSSYWPNLLIYKLKMCIPELKNNWIVLKLHINIIIMFVCELTGSTNSNFFLSCTSWILKTYCSDAS